MELDDDPNQYEDISVPAGCDLQWGFQLEPWNGTGSSAQFIVNPGASQSTYAMTVTNSMDGEDAVMELDVHLTPAQLTTLALATSGSTAPYVIRWTDSNGKLWGLGFGQIVIE